jgi:hypothetical protein
VKQNYVHGNNWIIPKHRPGRGHAHSTGCQVPRLTANTGFKFLGWCLVLQGFGKVLAGRLHLWSENGQRLLIFPVFAALED